ncbi:MAG: serine/threonine protein kinase [Polyangiaceae bacterium]|nr:serine/threonine protein kinase [Polyangiaceae bacterium]
MQSKKEPEIVGRYELFDAIARGGMATIHLARLTGEEGFSRIVAAKRLHASLIEDGDFVQMFLDEAHIAARIHHPNVVSALDVVRSDRELILVQEYVRGVPLNTILAKLREHHAPMPLPILLAIAGGTLAGLHGAHETRDETGRPLQVVHRDVSPQNVMVDADGTPKLLDFGIAKAATSAHVTREGLFKGKVSYMPPEQLRGEVATRQSDLYAMGIVLWEMAAGRRMFQGTAEAQLFGLVLKGELPNLVETLASANWQGSAADLDAVADGLAKVVRRATALKAEERFESALQMQDALYALGRPALPQDVAQWLVDVAGTYLEQQDQVVASQDFATTSSWRRRPPESNASGVMARSGPAPTRSAAPPVVAGDPSGYEALDAPPKERSNRALLLVLGLLGALLLLSGAIIAVMWSRSTATVASAPAVAPPSASSPSSVRAPEVALASSAAALPSALANDGAPMPSGHTAALGRAAPLPPRPGGRFVPPTAPAPRPAASVAPAATASNCDPPYYFEGTKKIFKPGCL